jgi:hypothetical protein
LDYVQEIQQHHMWGAATGSRTNNKGANKKFSTAGVRHIALLCAGEAHEALTAVYLVMELADRGNIADLFPRPPEKAVGTFFENRGNKWRKTAVASAAEAEAAEAAGGLRDHPHSHVNNHTILKPQTCNQPHETGGECIVSV